MDDYATDSNGIAPGDRTNLINLHNGIGWLIDGEEVSTTTLRQIRTALRMADDSITAAILRRT